MRISDTTRHERSGRLSPADSRRAARGVVVTYPRRGETKPASHESVTRRLIAQKLAAVRGYEFGGDHDGTAEYEGKVYVVPADTLVGADAARTLGVYTEDDLFGGVVPFAFVGTKSITHPLADDGALTPPGWCEDFSRRVRRAVLRGCSAFSREDAQRAGERLLGHGAVRVKPSAALGGRGQTLVGDAGALHAALAGLDAAGLARYGVVVEENLTKVKTYSVGRVVVGDLVVTYFGTQKLTADPGGAKVYGGSDLTVARGGFDALLALDMDSAARLAIEQARLYDAAADACFPGFFASRRNYDVASGYDAQGKATSGVLEQSWRIGGATSAEIAALEAFHADPPLTAVCAECTETYGDSESPPAGATVYFRGIDPEVGFITKYARLVPHADA
jgi:hypothetical protein